MRWASSNGAPILLLDVPSGIDSTDGKALEPTVRAMATLTLALPKTGFLALKARSYLGELYLADIGVPPEGYLELGIKGVDDLFSRDDLIKLD